MGTSRDEMDRIVLKWRRKGPKEGLVSNALAFDDDQRQVVHGLGFADEFGQCLVNPVTQAGSRAATIPLNDLDQTGLAELLTLLVLAFSHAVGINDHHVARFQLHPAFAVITKLRDADRETANV